MNCQHYVGEIRHESKTIKYIPKQTRINGVNEFARHPDLGLFFWMAVAFIVVLLILSKFAFPIIVKMVDERQKFINDSLINARAANEQLATIQAEGEKILRSAREEQAKILKDAMATRDAIVKDAQQKATAEGEKLLEEAKAQILVEKENALRDIRAQVADLSIRVAEQLVMEQLKDENKQEDYIYRILDKVEA